MLKFGCCLKIGRNTTVVFFEKEMFLQKCISMFDISWILSFEKRNEEESSVYVKKLALFIFCIE